MLDGGPLTGMRVIEIGSTVAGPFCGRMLADFGAEVIKIEPPEGDALRTMGKQFEGKSLYAASMFRNKRLVALDLHREEARAIVRALAERADAVIENFKPGTLEAWGLGWADLSALNPRLVMVRISGYGQDGPYSARPGYGVICEAVSGLRHLTGDPDRPPSRIAVSLTDYITGLHGAFGAVMALLARGVTGRGQVIDAALYECAFNFMEPWIPAYQKLGHVAGRTGSRLAESTPNNLYPTADGELIHITAMADGLFRRLGGAMGQAGLGEDPRFAKALERNANADALDEIIAAWTGRLALSDIEARLQAAGVPATRIYTIADIFKDPHYRARRSIVESEDPDLGPVAMATVVPRLSTTPGGIRHPGHRIGEDTRKVLADVLGYDTARTDALARDGVIACGG
jgi:crotonobetainyl-CoA:carnitine CoA-transferase CaiB-like acyl-CoA transferase